MHTLLEFRKADVWVFLTACLGAFLFLMAIVRCLCPAWSTFLSPVPAHRLFSGTEARNGGEQTPAEASMKQASLPGVAAGGGGLRMSTGSQSGCQPVLLPEPGTTPLTSVHSAGP